MKKLFVCTIEMWRDREVRAEKFDICSLHNTGHIHVSAVRDEGRVVRHVCPQFCGSAHEPLS